MASFESEYLDYLEDVADERAQEKAKREADSRAYQIRLAEDRGRRSIERTYSDLMGVPNLDRAIEHYYGEVVERYGEEVAKHVLKAIKEAVENGRKRGRQIFRADKPIERNDGVTLVRVSIPEYVYHFYVAAPL